MLSLLCGVPEKLRTRNQNIYFWADDFCNFKCEGLETSISNHIFFSPQILGLLIHIYVPEQQQHRFFFLYFTFPTFQDFYISIKH